ncbi:hypothetical protein [Daejeonella sp.]|uniref:hypothetical protein n=1 Tax=Daejeonella sp. TaxID=2805397 RepID=UPI0030C56932
MKTEDQTAQIILDQTAIEHLRAVRKWSSFLSIIGFVVIGIMLLSMVGVIFMAARFPQDDLIRHTAIFQFLPIALLMFIYGIPIYYLYQFGKYSKIAPTDYDPEAITKAFQYLKLHYRFMGILVIVVLLFYIIAICVMLMAFPFISSMMP